MVCQEKLLSSETHLISTQILGNKKDSLITFLCALNFYSPLKM